MTDDLVVRLREVPSNGTAKLDQHNYWLRVGEITHEAADRIEQLEYENKDWLRISERYADRIEQLELIEKAFEQNQQVWSRNIARIEKLEAALRWYAEYEPTYSAQDFRSIARKALEGKDER